jgi:DNA-binding NarL/FixJ family response regulator
MLRIVLATNRLEAMQAFVEGLSSNPEVHLEHVVSGAEALETARASAPHLVIIDTGLQDCEPLELARKLLRVNAMVNTVVVSPLSEEEFHEASEGLGVLGRLPQEPGESDAAEVLHRLNKVLGAMG